MSDLNYQIQDVLSHIPHIKFLWLNSHIQLSQWTYDIHLSILMNFVSHKLSCNLKFSLQKAACFLQVYLLYELKSIS